MKTNIKLEIYKELQKLDAYLYHETMGNWCVKSVQLMYGIPVFIGYGTTPELAIIDAKAAEKKFKKENKWLENYQMK